MLPRAPSPGMARLFLHHTVRDLQLHYSSFFKSHKQAQHQAAIAKKLLQGP